MPFIYDIPERKQPATQELESGEEWVLMKGFHFILPNGHDIFVPPSGIGTEAHVLTAPVWTTDYGSIPRAFQNLFSPTKYGGAYLLHDWLYAAEVFTRSNCDWILLQALQEQGANWFTRNTIYSAVRAGGWAVWRKHNSDTVKTLKEYAKLFDA